MANVIAMKSKSTGLIGMYPEDHLELSDDLVAVDSEGNVIEPKDTPSESKPKASAQNDSKDKK